MKMQSRKILVYKLEYTEILYDNSIKTVFVQWSQRIIQSVLQFTVFQKCIYCQI